MKPFSARKRASRTANETAEHAQKGGNDNYRKKELMDALRITASNIFRNVQE